MSLEKQSRPDNSLAVKFKVSAAFFILGTIFHFSSVAGTFRVATYNIENYLDTPTETRHFVKSARAKSEIRKSIEAIKPDVLALEEMGTTNALMELRQSLKVDGQNFPFWEFIEGTDTNIHVAVLSKFPIISRHPHTNDEFLLDGKRFRVSRGIADVEVQVSPNFTFTLIAAHLKSRLNDTAADPAEQRLGEAKILRKIVDDHFKSDANAKIIVLGDFNDSPDSDSLRTIIGHGKFKLTDTRPADQNGDDSPALPPYFHPPRVAWTYYFGKNDSYSRIDYILLSPAMARVWMTNETYALTISNWGTGSDHRPIVAAFEEK